jgi:hypothetical protein
MGGNPDGTAYRAAFICEHVRFHGNPAFSITYKPEELNRTAPLIELVH